MSARSETRAEAFRGAAGPDGIAIEFGCLAEPRPDGATTIALTDRIVMPVETAQRLLLTLGESLQRAGVGSPPPARGAAHPGPSRGEVPVNAPPDAAAEQAALLVRLVTDLETPYHHERSFRLAERELLANRFLLTIDRDDIGEGRLERVLQICRRLGLPRSLEPAVSEHFDGARCIHFGFEAGPDGVLFKLYLERAYTTGEAERARETSQPLPLHLAFKWHVDGRSHVVSRYLWHPLLPLGELERRLGALYEATGQSVPLDIARAVLTLAASRAPAERLQYLEVVEDGNDRRSFDLNLYDARLEVRDIQHLLSRMRAHYGIRPGQFQALFDQVRARALGHLAGGAHRDGRDFFNIYYGVEGRPRTPQAEG